MIAYDTGRNAQGQVIALVDQQALQTWLRFGTTSPPLSTLTALLRRTRQDESEKRLLVSTATMKFTVRS